MGLGVALEQFTQAWLIAHYLVIEDDQLGRPLAGFRSGVSERLLEGRSSNGVIAGFLQRSQDKGPRPLSVHDDENSWY
jgi:hypothetical protein